MKTSSQHNTKLDTLINWAKEQGATVSSVGLSNRPGKGTCIVAERRLKKGENIIFIPAKLLITTDCDISSAQEERELFQECSVHGQIAGKLLLVLISGEAHHFAPWISSMPSLEEFRLSMPGLWNPAFHSSLPEEAKKLLDNSQSNFLSDLEKTCARDLPKVDQWVKLGLTALRDLYTHAWFLVNTRCFYWDYSSRNSAITKRANENSGQGKKGPQQRKRKLDRNDFMALCPVIDQFNHSDEEGCNVSYSREGYTATCVRDHEPGEEIFVTYGNHSNDYLLVEYGFIMTANSADRVNIDHLILPLLSQTQKQRLRKANLLGNYTLDGNGICYRTEAALRIVLVRMELWTEFVKGLDDGSSEQKTVDEYCSNLLRRYLEEIDTSIAQILQSNSSNAQDQRAMDTVQTRWKQIREMCQGTLSKIDKR